MYLFLFILFSCIIVAKFVHYLFFLILLNLLLCICLTVFVICKKKWFTGLLLYGLYGFPNSYRECRERREYERLN